MSRQKQVTYLLGAGASFGERGGLNGIPRYVRGLPIMQEIKDSLRGLLRKTESKNWQVDYAVNEIPVDKFSQMTAEDITRDIQWLLSAFEDHETIDAFAKKLAHDRNQREFFKLKALLSVLFMFIQGNNKPDIRYDNFISDLLIDDFANEKYLNPNVKVLSWNYDFQLETTIHRYFQDYDLRKLHQEVMQAYPGVGIDISSSPFDEKKFSCVKLNGTAGLFVDKDKKINTFPNYFPFPKSIFKYLLWYDTVMSHHETIDIQFQYAWKPSNFLQTIETMIKQIAQRTDVLIIIGYSFHPSNRAVDDILFKNLHRIQKIYIQDMGKSPFEIETKIRNNYINLDGAYFDSYHHETNLSRFISFKDV